VSPCYTRAISERFRDKVLYKFTFHFVECVSDGAGRNEFIEKVGWCATVD